MLPLAKKGVRVEVPVRGHLRKGFIADIKAFSDFKTVLPIHRILSEVELISNDLFELAVWMAKYYAAPLNKVLKSI